MALFRCFSNRRLLLPVCVLALSACSAMDRRVAPYWMPADAARFPTVLESLMTYHAYAGRLTAAEWGRESARVKAAAGSGEEGVCVRQAILAATAAAPAGERAQAAALYDRCERELIRRDSALAGLVTLLRSEHAERARAEERQREAVRRAEDLNQKLNELKTIERTLHERGVPVRAR